MLHDLNGFDRAERVIEADIAIIGAGAAGIAMARRLSGRGLKIALVESGGLKPEALARSLNAGRNIGLPYYAPDISRERIFGGTTATWSGRCIPLDPIDFRKRDWVPHSGWPVSYDELLPFYHDAQSVMQVGDFRYDDSLWQDIGLSPEAFDDEAFRVRFWRIESLRMGKAYREELERSRDVDVYLHGTASRIVPEGSRIDRVVLRVTGRPDIALKARHFVLAAGGIENPRLLLASNDVERQGIGNARDLVGRFFMEHPKCRTARIEGADVTRLLERWRKQFPKGLPALWPALIATDALQEREGLLNSSLAFYYRSLEGVNEAAAALKRDFTRREFSGETWSALRTVMKALPYVPGNLKRRLIDRRSAIIAPQAIYLLTRAEQAPNPDSRVVLSSERDANGEFRADVDWRLSPLDKSTVRTMTHLFADRFAAKGYGRVIPDRWLEGDDAEWPLPTGAEGEDHHAVLQGGHHHIGTTRMASDENQGVVDADGKVFGKGNLFIAGSSVFPTSGWANPTLTLVALALRQADHLIERSAG